VLTFVDDPAYRREMKAMRNLNEGRHDLARHLFHGRKGELHQAYRAGQEDQLGALGLVLNCATAWNTVYLIRKSAVSGQAAASRLRFATPGRGS
jgi:TnpA family transposase